MRLNLSNQTLKIGYNNNLPYALFDSETNESLGMEIVLIKTLAKYFNFTIEMVWGKGVYGSKLPNESWSGLIGELLNNEIDLAIGSFTMNYDRFKVIKFIYPHMVDPLTFATASPNRKVGLDILIRPFPLMLWLCFAGVFIMFFTFDRIKICFHISPKEYGRKRFKNGSFFWISFFLLFRQPYHFLNSLSVPMKICSIVWLFSAMVLTDLYSGYLCSLLTIQSIVTIETVTNLAEICREKDIISLGYANSTIYDVFKNSQIGSFQEIFKVMQPIKDFQEGIKTILSRSRSSQEYALIAAHNFLEYFHELHGKDSFYIPPENDEATFYPTFVSMPARPTFEYQNEFSKIILYLDSAGLPEQWIQNLMLQIPTVRSKEDTKEELDKKFSLMHLASVFLLYLFCIIISFLIFIVEIIHYKHKQISKQS